MAVQNGKDVLIKVLDPSSSSTFITMAGLRSTRLSLNAQTIDVTSMESEGWRELLSGAGLRSATISGSGIFRDEETDTWVKTMFFNGDAAFFQVIIPDFAIIEGSFVITAIEYSGSYNGEATYDISLASAGTVSFQTIEDTAPVEEEPE